jgi:hypothetical protein
MPRRKEQEDPTDPVLYLKTLALRDEPLVQQYRDMHYVLVLDQLQATGQRIANRERVTPLSDAKRQRLMNQHVSLAKKICNKYNIPGFQGGDPCIIERNEWLATLSIRPIEAIEFETNWETPLYSPRVRLLFFPKEEGKVFSSDKGTLIQLPTLSKHPVAPPLLTVRVDLSQVKSNHIAELVEEFKQAVRQCIEALPRRFRKPSGTWQGNVERDYRRFKQHYRLGISYRAIAAYERIGEVKHHIGERVPAESSISNTVERVHLILFNKRYRQHRSRFRSRDDNYLRAAASYNCPKHGKDCTSTCSSYLTFIRYF